MEKVLVVGLGVSGLACIKGLNRLGAEIYAFDEAPREKLREGLKEIEGIKADFYFGNEEIEKIDFQKLSYVIKSPGIKYEVPIIKNWWTIR